MALSADLREFIELLDANGVEFLVVGAHALALHARPRYTGDLDLFIRADQDNAQKICVALREFGFSGFSEEDFLEPEQVMQLGRAPNRIDLLTSLSGVTFEEAWETRVTAKLDDLEVAFLSRDLLIRNKRVTDRPQDRADLETLEDG